MLLVRILPLATAIAAALLAGVARGSFGWGP